MPAPEIQVFYLTRHTFCALVDAQVVFLDLRGDRYYCLPPAQTEAVRSLLEAGFCPDLDPDELIRTLIGAELITARPGEGKAFKPIPSAGLTVDLMGYAIGRDPGARPGHAVRIFYAAALTALRLRWMPLTSVVNRVRNRKRRACHQSDESTSKPAPTRDLVEVFKRLRPLMFTAKDQCLYDSLVLIEFLAAYDRFPTWVIGVKMGPFAAHSWVQDDTFVYNDAASNVARFTPIMTV